MLTKRQINKLKKAMSLGVGSDIKISKTQIRKAVRICGSLFSSLMSAAPFAMPLAKKVGGKLLAPLATGAVQALGSLGVDKIFGSGQKGGFLIPQNKINQLIAYKHLLSSSQKKQILDALQTGGQLVIKPTPTQRGGFLGTLLASIGVPLLLKALTGKGLQVDKSGSPQNTVSVYIPPKKGGRHTIPIRPPPFLETWENPIGMGMKKKRKPRKKGGQGLTIREKQSFQFNTNIGNDSMRFVNKPLSNFDLMNWVKYMGIKHFRRIFSRDNLPNKMKKSETGIVNLDTKLGNGTHWVAYRNVDDTVCEYFDSFGLIMPFEIQKYLQTSGDKLIYSSDEIQERNSVLCGYWCLYYLYERQIGRSLLEVIHSASFDPNDHSVNHRFIINYFKNI